MQKASRFPVGDHKAAMENQESMINTNMNYKKDPRKKHRFGSSIKIFKLVLWYNLTFISDVEQDKYMFGLHERSLPNLITRNHFNKLR